MTRTWDLPDGLVQDGLMGVLLDAGGAELDRLDDTFAQLALLAHPGTAPDWGVAKWENELGLLPDPSLTTAQRQARAAARFIGLRGPVGPYLTDQVRTAIRQADAPAVIVRQGLWNVWKPILAGWPGDREFLEAERRLDVGGKAPLGDNLAPWDECNGLTIHQMDLMAVSALQELTIREMDGGYCPPPPWPAEFLLDAIDGTPLDVVDAMLLDDLEFGTPPDDQAWLLERFDTLTLEQVNAINLEEMD